MSNFRDVFSRWRGDYDFRTFTTAFGSMLATALFAVYNGYIGLFHDSSWHKGIAVYYLLLMGIRFFLLYAEHDDFRRRASGGPEGRSLIPLTALFLLLNLSLPAPFAMMVKQEKTVSLTLIPAIAMAAYTVYKISLASFHLKRKNRSANAHVRLLRTINFADALVSIITLQNTLIMVNSPGGNPGMLPLTAISSGAAWLVIVLLSAYSLVRAVHAAEEPEKPRKKNRAERRRP